ncbi:unnamed protein product [Calypogeia fissa]
MLIGECCKVQRLAYVYMVTSPNLMPSSPLMRLTVKVPKRQSLSALISNTTSTSAEHAREQVTVTLLPGVLNGISFTKTMISQSEGKLQCG